MEKISLKTIIKFFAKSSGILVLGTAFAGIIFLNTSIPEKLFQHYLRFNLENRLDKHVILDKVSGNFLSDLSLNGLKISNSTDKSPIFDAKEIKFSYSILDMIMSFGYVPNAVKTITIRNGNFYLERDEQGKWKLKEFESSDHSNDFLKKIPSFEGKISLQEFKLHYIDKRGWGEKPLPKPFYETLDNVSGDIVFTKNKPAILHLKGVLNSTKSPVDLDGTLNPKTIAYSINFNIQKMNVDQWGPYVLAFEGFHLHKNTAKLNGNIRTNPNPSSHLPFWYELNFSTTDSELKIPYINQAITGISGKARVYHGTLSPSLLKEDFPKFKDAEAKELFNALVKIGYINQEGQIHTERPNYSRFPSKWTPYRKKIASILENPREKTEFINMHGKLGALPAHLNGFIQMNHIPFISIQCSNKQADLATVATAFPELETLHLKGIGPAAFKVIGPLHSPRLIGNFQTTHGEISGLSVSQIKTEFEIKDNKFMIKSPSLTYLNNTWSAQGSITLSHAFIDLNFMSNTFKAQNIQGLEPYAEGVSKINVSVTGFAPSLNVHILGDSTQAKIFKQNLSHLNVILKTGHTLPYTLKGTVEGPEKSQTVDVTGEISKQGNLCLLLKTHHYPLYDFYSKDPDTAPGLLDAEAELILKESLEAHLEISGLDIPFNGKRYKTVEASTFFKNNTWTITTLEAKNASERLAVQGLYQDNGPIDLKLIAKNVSLSQNWMQNFIPETLKPFSGLLNANLTINRSKGNRIPNITGKASIENGTIIGQRVENLTSEFDYTNDTLRIQSMTIAQDISKIGIKGTVKGQLVDLDILENSQIDLDEFSTLLHTYGNFRGIVQGKAHISGPWFSPKIEASFQTLNFQTALQSFDKIKGSLVYDPPYLKLSSITIESNQNQYQLQGQWNLKDLSQHLKNNSSPYMFKLSIEKGDVQTFISIIDALYSEFRVTESLEKVHPEKITNPNITLSAQDENGNTLLFERGNTQNALDQFLQKIHQDVKLSAQFASTWFKDIRGNLQGELSIIGNPDNIPIVNAHLSLSDFEYKKFTSKAINIVITPDQNNTTYTLVCEKGKLGSTPFASLFSSGNINPNGMLSISKLEIDSDLFNKSPILEGQFPLEPFWNNETQNQSMNLKFTLDKNQINLLTPLLPNVQELTNEGKIIGTITGPLNAPQLNTIVCDIHNASIQFNDKIPLLNAPLFISSASVSIKNNTIQILDCPVNWEQQQAISAYLKSSTKYTNHANLSGLIQIAQCNLLNLNDLALFFDLHVEPTTLYLATPIVKGTLEIESASFKGLATIPISNESVSKYNQQIKNKNENGATLHAKIKVRNNTISLVREQGNNTDFYPMIGLDIETKIEKNVEVTTSLFSSSLLAGISTNFEFEEKESPLKITGTLNHPIINDTLVVKNGNIDLFNRSFKLLTAQEQKRYQPPGQTSNAKNTITFSPYLNSTEGLSPIFNLAAATVIDKNLPLTTNITTETNPYTHVVLMIDGSISTLKEFRFDVFDSTAPQTFSGSLVYKNTYYIPTNFSEAQTTQREANTSQIIELLMPELFIQNQSSSEELLSQYGENRVNMLLRQEILRPIEKQISNRVGLYDLRIDYNLGGDLFRRTDTTHRSVGIDAIQRVVSDQLFLRVRTDIELESDRQKSQDTIGVSEIELTYYLLKNRNMSINYANIKDPNVRSDYHPKLSLRFSHEF